MFIRCTFVAQQPSRIRLLSFQFGVNQFPSNPERYRIREARLCSAQPGIALALHSSSKMHSAVALDYEERYILSGHPFQRRAVTLKSGETQTTRRTPCPTRARRHSPTPARPRSETHRCPRSTCRRAPYPLTVRTGFSPAGRIAPPLSRRLGPGERNYFPRAPSPLAHPRTASRAPPFRHSARPQRRARHPPRTPARVRISEHSANPARVEERGGSVRIAERRGWFRDLFA